MTPVYSDLIHFKGSHYDFGYYQGKQLIDSPIMNYRQKHWASRRKHHFIINQKTYLSVIRKFLPAMVDELQGLADALELSLEESIVQFGGYYLEFVRSGCSIFTTKEFMIRNYDNHPNTYEGRYVIFQPTDSGYATVGPSMQITGRTDGMNEKGLAMGYNFVNRRQSDDGFVCNMIGRIILESCETVADAIDLLREIPHRHSFSYVLLDPEGETYIVEASPRKVIAHQGFVCTNHFYRLTDENRYRMDDSKAREQIINSKSAESQQMLDAFHLLNNDKNGVYSHNYGAFNGTLHTAVYSPQSMKIGIALGMQKYPLMFDFQQLFDQENIRVKRIRGAIKYKHPFINEYPFTLS